MGLQLSGYGGKDFSSRVVRDGTAVANGGTVIAAQSKMPEGRLPRAGPQLVVGEWAACLQQPVAGARNPLNGFRSPMNV